MGKVEVLKIRVAIIRRNTELHKSIADNGPGMHYDRSGQFKRGGSLDLIDQYIHLYNQGGNGRAVFNIHKNAGSEAGNSGTEVMIKIN